VRAQRKLEEAARETGERLRLALQTSEALRQEDEGIRKLRTILLEALHLPTKPILASLDILLADKKAPRKALLALRSLRRQLLLQSRLIEDLMEMDRIMPYEPAHEFGPVDLFQAFRDAFEICRTNIRLKKQNVFSNWQAERYYARGEALRLQHIFWNLIRNASKFTPEGGKLFLNSWNLLDRIVIEVKDTGTGLSKDKLSSVFDSDRNGVARSRAAQGIGVGLPSSKLFIEAIGGKLSVASAGEKRGATFTVELPTVSHQELPFETLPKNKSSKYLFTD